MEAALVGAVTRFWLSWSRKQSTAVHRQGKDDLIALLTNLETDKVVILEPDFFAHKKNSSSFVQTFIMPFHHPNDSRWFLIIGDCNQKMVTIYHYETDPVNFLSDLHEAIKKPIMKDSWDLQALAFHELQDDTNGKLSVLATVFDAVHNIKVPEKLKCVPI